MGIATVVSILWASIPFSISFAVLFSWLFKFVFNHNILHAYTNRIHVDKAHINEYIKVNINYKYQVLLAELNILDSQDKDERHVRKPVKSLAIGVEEYFIRAIFSLTITFSIQLIFIMMFELVSDQYDTPRFFLFKLVIDALIVLLTVVQPFIMIYMFVSGDLHYGSSSKPKILFTSILFVSWLFILHKLGHISNSFTTNPTINSKSLLERKVSEVSFAGISILAILSGIGSISTPYRQALFKNIYFRLSKNPSYVQKSKEISDSDLNNLIRSFNHSTTLLIKRQNDLNRLHVANGGTIYNNPQSSSPSLLSYHGVESSPKKKLGGLIHKVQSFASLSSLSLNSANSEEVELTNEIKSLKQLRDSIYEDIVKTLTTFKGQKDQYIGNTASVNQIKKCFNLLFGFYCLYRIFNVFLIKLPIQYWQSGEPSESKVIDEKFEDSTISNTHDALAITLSKLFISVFKLSISEAQLIPQVCFILSGSLFVCSFSNVLTTFKSFGKFFPSIHKSSEETRNWQKHIIISELLGIYVISTALLIRTNLPSNLSHQISKVLSLSGSSVTNTKNIMIEVKFIDNWFDKLFAISALSTFLSLLVKNYVDNDNFEDDYDEEMLMEDPGLHKVS